MELIEAVQIVRSLAEGVDPATGEPFEMDAPYNHPEVIRALFTVLDLIPRQKRTLEDRREENARRGLPRNSGLPWSEDARKSVASAFRSGAAIDVIAKSEERSPTAIAAELVRQGEISAEEAERHGYTVRARGKAH